MATWWDQSVGTRFAGPTVACRALNFGISLFAEFHGRGLGAAAQHFYWPHTYFRRMWSSRVEATADADDLAEQRALEKAGFAAEGVFAMLSSKTANGVMPSCTAACGPIRL